MCSRHKGEKDCILYLLSTFAVAFKRKQLQKTRSTRWQHTQIWTLKTSHFLHQMERGCWATWREPMQTWGTCRLHTERPQTGFKAKVFLLWGNSAALYHQYSSNLSKSKMVNGVQTTKQIWNHHVRELTKTFEPFFFFLHIFTYLSCWGVSLHNHMLTPNAIFFSVLLLQFNFQCVSLCSWINTPITE